MRAGPNVQALCLEFVAIVFLLGTRIDLCVAVQAGPPVGARAPVPVNSVRAYTTVLARRRNAFGDIDLAVVPDIPTHTDAGVQENVVEARGAVQACLGGTLVQLLPACSDRDVAETG